MSKEFNDIKVKEKKDYGTGATRDNSTGKGRFDLIPDLALHRVAKVYEKGGVNHGFRNWEKGIPLSRMIDSALRHIQQYKMSKYRPELRDEDHLAHACWNLLGILHEEEMIERGWLSEELDDLPRYGHKEEKPDCLKTLSDEELEKIEVPTKGEIEESLRKGAEERDAMLRPTLNPVYRNLPESPMVEEDDELDPYFDRDQ